MAHVITPRLSETQKKFAARIRSTVRSGLKKSGIEVVKIFIEPLPRTKLVRVTVVSPEFASLRFSERQDLIWRVISGEISYEQQLLISMIITITPHELVGEEEA